MFHKIECAFGVGSRCFYLLQSINHNQAIVGLLNSLYEVVRKLLDCRVILPLKDKRPTMTSPEY